MLKSILIDIPEIEVPTSLSKQKILLIALKEEVFNHLESIGVEEFPSLATPVRNNSEPLKYLRQYLNPEKFSEDHLKKAIFGLYLFLMQKLQVIDFVLSKRKSEVTQQLIHLQQRFQQCFMVLGRVLKQHKINFYPIKTDDAKEVQALQLASDVEFSFVWRLNYEYTPLGTPNLDVQYYPSTKEDKTFVQFKQTCEDAAWFLNASTNNKNIYQSLARDVFMKTPQCAVAMLGSVAIRSVHKSLELGLESIIPSKELFNVRTTDTLSMQCHMYDLNNWSSYLKFITDSAAPHINHEQKQFLDGELQSARRNMKLRELALLIPITAKELFEKRHWVNGFGNFNGKTVALIWEDLLNLQDQARVGTLPLSDLILAFGNKLTASFDSLNSKMPSIKWLAGRARTVLKDSLQKVIDAASVLGNSKKELSVRVHLLYTSINICDTCKLVEYLAQYFQNLSPVEQLVVIKALINSSHRDEKTNHLIYKLLKKFTGNVDENYNIKINGVGLQFKFVDIVLNYNKSILYKKSAINLNPFNRRAYGKFFKDNLVDRLRKRQDDTPLYVEPEVEEETEARQQRFSNAACAELNDQVKAGISSSLFRLLHKSFRMTCSKSSICYRL